jgi:hypothetical protein
MKFVKDEEKPKTVEFEGKEALGVNITLVDDILSRLNFPGNVIFIYDSPSHKFLKQVLVYYREQIFNEISDRINQEKE